MESDGRKLSLHHAWDTAPGSILIESQRSGANQACIDDIPSCGGLVAVAEECEQIRHEF
jgi:hypothetical protein